MKTFLVIFALLFTLLLTISCGTAKKIDAIKPAASNANPVVFKNKVSFISMPVEVWAIDVDYLYRNNVLFYKKLV